MTKMTLNKKILFKSASFSMLYAMYILEQHSNLSHIIWTFMIKLLLNIYAKLLTILLKKMLFVHLKIDILHI